MRIRDIIGDIIGMGSIFAIFWGLQAFGYVLGW